jgi:hypothetical protein
MKDGDGKRDERKRKSVAEGDNDVLSGRHGRVGAMGRKRDSPRVVVCRPDKAASPPPVASIEIPRNDIGTRKHTAGKKGNVFSCVKKIKDVEYS